MPLVVALAYALGLLLGWLATRKGTFAEVWPNVVRAQMLAAPLLLTVAAVWRLKSFDELLWPIVLASTILVLFAATWSTLTPPLRTAHATLQTMSTAPNSGFFVIPIAAAIGGPVALVIAVLMDRIVILLWSGGIHLLRREAPIAQSRRTGFADQASVIAMLVGLLLRFTGPAPEWTATMALWTAPVLALSGAATFIGSALHPSQRIDYRPGVPRWLKLVGLRVLMFAIIAVMVPNHALLVVAVLCALSIPTFTPPQFSALYGYADTVVAAGNRLGWLVGAVGVVVVFGFMR